MKLISQKALCITKEKDLYDLGISSLLKTQSRHMMRRS